MSRTIAEITDQQPPPTERTGALMAELLECADEQPVVQPPIVNPQVVLDVVVSGRRYQLVRAASCDPAVSLSSRELEIARMIAAGHTNRTIAAVLEISPWTVSTHLRRVFAKLNVGSRAAMVAQLVAAGLLLAPTAEDSPRAALLR